MRSFIALTTTLLLANLTGCCWMGACSPCGYSSCVPATCATPALPTPSSYAMDVGMPAPSCGCGVGCIDTTCAAPGPNCGVPTPGCAIPDYAVPSGCDCGTCGPANYSSCVGASCSPMPHLINPDFFRWMFCGWWMPRSWGCTHNAYMPTYYEVNDIAGYPDPSWESSCPHCEHQQTWSTPVETTTAPAAVPPAAPHEPQAHSPIETPMPLGPTPVEPVPSVQQMSWQQPSWAPPRW